MHVICYIHRFDEVKTVDVIIETVMGWPRRELSH